MLGQSSLLCQLDYLGQSSLLGQSDYWGQSNLLGQSSLSGQSSLLGQSNLSGQQDYLSQSDNIGQSKPVRQNLRLFIRSYLGLVENTDHVRTFRIRSQITCSGFEFQPLSVSKRTTDPAA